jgi:hypothetical protein
MCSIRKSKIHKAINYPGQENNEDWGFTELSSPAVVGTYFYFTYFSSTGVEVEVEGLIDVT